MFVRRTQTRTRLSGEPYFTHRLVRTERVDGRVKQVTLLNLGRHFDVPPAQWPLFCTRLSELLSPQASMTPTQVPAALAHAVQRYAEQLQPRAAAGVGRVEQRRPVTRRGEVAATPTTAELDLQMPAAVTATPTTSSDLVHADTLELRDGRSVGVEALALHAIEQLGIADTLRTAGFNRISLAAAVGQIVARMAKPASERASHAWLQRHSALGELWGFDFERLSLTRLYRIADAMWRQHDAMETALYQRISATFGLHDTIALYDLTNTYFEGLAHANPSARRGHSKEKRSDAPLITLGMVLDGAGFVRRSQVFAGNVREQGSLPIMLAGLNAPAGALVVLDRGIVSEANLAWLRENGYRYLVMSRERRDLGPTAQTLSTANDAPIHWQRIAPADDNDDVRLICHSPDRELKEAAMTTLKRTRFEAKLAALAAGLGLPHRSKRADRIHQRIGRLRQAYPSVARHYLIEVDTDADLATAIRYQYTPAPNSKAELPGHYLIRSNATDLDGETLWRTYVQLTELEAVFRSLKSELGLRPIYHHLDNRCRAHLWISVLAYQCVQFLRRTLKAQGIDASWDSIRKTLAQQQRITASFNAEAGGTLHVRKATTPDAHAAAIYRALGLNDKPGGTRKRLFKYGRDL
ncbi:MAG: IS1634 family transposase [Lysobacterales bacterium]